MTTPLERHRFEFEGSTAQLARHLTEEHGVPETALAQWVGGLTQGDWIALDNVHRSAHNETRERSGMNRPTADDMYARAKGALDDADQAASSGGRAGTSVHDHLAVAMGFQSLAESLAARERRPYLGSKRGTSSDTVIQAASSGQVKP